MGETLKIITENSYIRIAISHMLEKISAKGHKIKLVIIDTSCISNANRFKKNLSSINKKNTRVLIIQSGNVISQFLSEFNSININDNVCTWQERIQETINSKQNNEIQTILKKISLDNFNQRDNRIAEMIKLNYNISAIAITLRLSRKTVYTHLNSMGEKLSIKGKDKIFHFIKNHL